MAQSTEDYLDSLLRQAMGIPDPEPETTPAKTPDMEREDVLAMADGLTGSNSAILGNAYDRNASFTNEGEIHIPGRDEAKDTVTAEAEEQNPVQETVPVEDLPDPDAPVAMETFAEPVISQDFESILPDIQPDETAAEEPVTLPDEPVSEAESSGDGVASRGAEEGTAVFAGRTETVSAAGSGAGKRSLATNSASSAPHSMNRAKAPVYIFLRFFFRDMAICLRDHSVK